MGVYFSSANRDYSIRWPLIVTILGFSLQIVEYALWLHKEQYALGIKFSSFIFSAGVIWLLFSKKIEDYCVGNYFFKTIGWIGGISFGIYLLHCYVIIAIDKLLPSINWIAKWTFVLSATILVIWVIKSLAPRFADKYLGFR